MSNRSPNDVMELTSADWDHIHEKVQEVFAEMARRVGERWPTISSRGGRTSTQRFPLFSYRTFQTTAQAEADAVVVGLDFQPQEQCVSIRGDISGEETGHVFFDQACEAEVEPDRESVLREGLAIARRLAGQLDKIHEALACPSQAPGEPS